MNAKTRIFSQRAVLPLCLSTIFSIWSSAEAASITFSPSSQTSSAGSSVTFAGTIQNTGSQTIFLNGDSISLFAPGITTDDTDFLFGAPLSLSPGETWMGTIFQLTIDATAPPATYNGSFSLYGGADSSTFEILGSGSFQQVVVGETSVPDLASTWALMLLGLVTTFGLTFFVRRIA